jgi:hypothetical protein
VALRARLLLAALLLSLTIAGTAACGSDGGRVTVRPHESGASGAGEPSGTSPVTSGGVADCGQILKTYGQLATTALKGRDAAASAEQTLAGIANELPADLQGDLAVVADAFGQIASKGVIDGASALTSSAFVTANRHILGYLRDDCLPG